MPKRSRASHEQGRIARAHSRLSTLPEADGQAVEQCDSDRSATHRSVRWAAWFGAARDATPVEERDEGMLQRGQTTKRNASILYAWWRRNARLFVALVMPLPVDVVVRPNLPTLPIPPLSVGAQPYLTGTPLQPSLGLRMLAGGRSPPRSPWSGPENLPWLINASQPTRVPIFSLDPRDYFRALKVGHVKVIRE
jgi:hypothetical protein